MKSRTSTHTSTNCLEDQSEGGVCSFGVNNGTSGRTLKQTSKNGHHHICNTVSFNEEDTMGDTVTTNASGPTLASCRLSTKHTPRKATPVRRRMQHQQMDSGSEQQSPQRAKPLPHVIPSGGIGNNDTKNEEGKQIKSRDTGVNNSKDGRTHTSISMNGNNSICNKVSFNEEDTKGDTVTTNASGPTLASCRLSTKYTSRKATLVRILTGFRERTHQHHSAQPHL